MEKKVLKFWTGRGGRYHNPGYITFVEFQSIIEGMTFESLFFDEEKETWFEENGNEADCEINEDGTGYLNIDHDYDTTRCVLEDRLNDGQVNAVIKAINGYGNSYFRGNQDLINIIEEHYPDKIDEIEKMKDL